MSFKERIWENTYLLIVMKMKWKLKDILQPEHHLNYCFNFLLSSKLTNLDYIVTNNKVFQKVCTSSWCHLLFQWFSCCKYFIGPEIISVVDWKACIILNFEHDILVCLCLKQALVLLSILRNRVDYTFYTLLK